MSEAAVKLKKQAWKITRVLCSYQVKLPWRYGVTNGLAEIVPQKGEEIVVDDMVHITSGVRRVSIPFAQVNNIHRELVDE